MLHHEPIDWTGPDIYANDRLRRPLMLWTRAFWMGAAERAIKTFFQTLVAVVGITAGSALIPEVGLEGVPWLGVLSASALAAVLSLATSIGNANFTAGSEG